MVVQKAIPVGIAWGSHHLLGYYNYTQITILENKDGGEDRWSSSATLIAIGKWTVGEDKKFIDSVY